MFIQGSVEEHVHGTLAEVWGHLVEICPLLSPLGPWDGAWVIILRGKQVLDPHEPPRGPCSSFIDLFCFEIALVPLRLASSSVHSWGWLWTSGISASTTLPSAGIPGEDTLSLSVVMGLNPRQRPRPHGTSTLHLSHIPSPVLFFHSGCFPLLKPWRVVIFSCFLDSFLSRTHSFIYLVVFTQLFCFMFLFSFSSFLFLFFLFCFSFLSPFFLFIRLCDRCYWCLELSSQNLNSSSGYEKV